MTTTVYSYLTEMNRDQTRIRLVIEDYTARAVRSLAVCMRRLSWQRGVNVYRRESCPPTLLTPESAVLTILCCATN
jgi:hypothetical protein